MTRFVLAILGSIGVMGLALAIIGAPHADAATADAALASYKSCIARGGTPGDDGVCKMPRRTYKFRKIRRCPAGYECVGNFCTKDGAITPNRCN